MSYKTLALCVLCLAAFLPVDAQIAPQTAAPDDASALVRAVGERYQAIRSFYAEGSVVLEMKSQQGNLTVEMPLTEAEVRPDKVRFELKDPKFGGARVSNGKTTWRYEPRFNRYSRTQGPPSNATSATSPLSSGGISEYTTLANALQKARKVGEETLVVNGSPVKCVIVEVTYATGNANPDIVSSPRVLWIDPALHLVVKDIADSTLNSTKAIESRVGLKFTKTLTAIRVDQPVPDQVFEFQPPEGAVEAPPAK